MQAAFPCKKKQNQNLKNCKSLNIISGQRVQFATDTTFIANQCHLSGPQLATSHIMFLLLTAHSRDHVKGQKESKL